MCPAKNQMNQQSQTSASTSNNVSEERITLVVDNTRFILDPAIFTAHPNTMLGRSVFVYTCYFEAILQLKNDKSITNITERGALECSSEFFVIFDCAADLQHFSVSAAKLRKVLRKKYFIFI